MGINYVTKFVGEPGFGDKSKVPQDVLRRRRQVYDAMRRFGSPVLVKHMWNAQDVIDGLAEASPNFDSVYGQSRNHDPISHGIGYVSVEKSDDEWYHTTTGEIVVALTNPDEDNYAQAPKYRGFGPGYLTYIIFPDSSVDLFKVNELGTFIQIQTASAQASWFPEINDNDLIINVILDEHRGSIIETEERFQAKQTNQISIRGLDRRGRRESSGLTNVTRGNRFVINQQFELVLIPNNDELYSVETER